MARAGSRTRTLIAASVAALALAAGAQAADAPQDWSVPQEIEKALPEYREFWSGWYLRGDIGYRLNKMRDVNTPVPLTSRSYDNMIAVSGGFGLKHRFFRADLTVDYMPPAKFNGSTASAAQQPQYVAKIDAATVLVNAYLDLGTWHRLTPYVGAGVGASYLRTHDYNDSTLPANELVPVLAKWSFSWAAMAGVSFNLAPRWSVDVGYRYLWLGDAKTDTDSLTNFTTFNGLSSQEVRVGLRFMLD
jgi:opacity protein-like surface antigen